MVPVQLYLLQPYFLIDEVWVHCGATKTQPSYECLGRGRRGGFQICPSLFLPYSFGNPFNMLWQYKAIGDHFTDQGGGRWSLSIAVCKTG